MVAGSKHSAIPHHGGRLRRNGLLQQCCQRTVLRQGSIQRGQQRIAKARQHGLDLRQLGKAGPQGRQITRTGAAQCHTRRNPLHVGHRVQRQMNVRVAGLQGGNGLLPGPHGGGVTQRVMQPFAQEPAAHAGDAAVQQREQGRCRFAADGFGQFQVAARGGIKVEVLAGFFDTQADNVRQFARLGAAGVFQQGTGSTGGHAQVSSTKAGQVLHAEVAGQPFAGAGDVKVPRWQPAHRYAGLLELPRRKAVVGNQEFGRFQALQLGAQPLGLGFQYAEITAGERQAGQAQPALVECQRHQPVFLLVVEQGGIGQRARCHHPHHPPLDRPLAGGRIADLFADCDGFAQFHQPGQILLDGMERYAGHGNGLAGRLAAGRQRDVQQAGGLFGIAVEHLVEVTHAVKQQRIRMVGFQGQILLHHGSVRGCGHVRRRLGVHGRRLYRAGAGFFTL